MYLSKLILNPDHNAARRDLETPYALHRTLLQTLPEPTRDGNRLLFRVEVDRRDAEAPIVFAQSSTARPEWLTLPEGYLLHAPITQTFTPCFPIGDQLSFRLVANPTGIRDGVRFALVDEHNYMSWLRRKGERHGFTPIDVEAVPFWLEQDVETPVTDDVENSAYRFGVRFVGTLRVEDPVRLRRAVETGLGSAKAFGFGLLSLSREIQETVEI